MRRERSSFGAGDEGLEPLGDTGGQFLARRRRCVAAEPQLGHRPVGAPGELLQVAAPLGGRVGRVAHRGRPLGLQRGRRPPSTGVRTSASTRCNCRSRATSWAVLTVAYAHRASSETTGTISRQTILARTVRGRIAPPPRARG